MASPARDTQRARVYAAESQLARIVDARGTYPTLDLFGSRVAVPDDRKFGDVDSVRRYLAAVLALNWVRARWPNASRPLTVRPRRGAAGAHYEGETATIAVPPFEVAGRWGLRELVVLHELAHHLESGTPPPHGPAFVTTMLALVEELVGPEAEFLLRTAYLENGVSLS